MVWSSVGPSHFFSFPLDNLTREMGLLLNQKKKKLSIIIDWPYEVLSYFCWNSETSPMILMFGKYVCPNIFVVTLRLSSITWEKKILDKCKSHPIILQLITVAIHALLSRRKRIKNNITYSIIIMSFEFMAKCGTNITNRNTR